VPFREESCRSSCIYSGPLYSYSRDAVSQHPSTRAGAESIQLIWSGRALQALSDLARQFRCHPIFWREFSQLSRLQRSGASSQNATTMNNYELAGETSLQASRWISRIHGVQHTNMQHNLHAPTAFACTESYLHPHNIEICTIVKEAVKGRYLNNLKNDYEWRLTFKILNMETRRVTTKIPEYKDCRRTPGDLRTIQRNTVH